MKETVYICEDNIEPVRLFENLAKTCKKLKDGQCLRIKKFGSYKNILIDVYAEHEYYCDVDYPTTRVQAYLQRKDGMLVSIHWGGDASEKFFEKLYNTKSFKPVSVLIMGKGEQYLFEPHE